MWEKLPQPLEKNRQYAGGDVVSDRLRVPGGWIVRTIVTRYQGGSHAAHTFITDPAHEWKLPEAGAFRDDGGVR
ncbi:MAG TPA: hypothetical protein VD862_03915 [Candidatus Paceibacterota bacterium]|nr:hypothetical protein [Candidatus Paceibacterota bacterium]